MKNKEIVLKRIFELNNLVISHRALLATNRSREEIYAHLERIEQKIHEIEVFINREENTF